MTPANSPPRKLPLVDNTGEETEDSEDTPVCAQNSRRYRRGRYRRAYLSRGAVVVRVVPICRAFIGRHLMAIRHRRSAEWRTSLPRSDTRVQWEQSAVRVLGRCFVSFRRWTSCVICHAFWPSPISSRTFFSASRVRRGIIKTGGLREETTFASKDKNLCQQWNAWHKHGRFCIRDLSSYWDEDFERSEI